MSNPIVPFGEEAVKSELRELVGKTIGETINAMFDEEVDLIYAFMRDKVPYAA